MMRLNKYLARSGVLARRKCDDYIFHGMVFVNGKRIENPGYQVDEKLDKVFAAYKQNHDLQLKIRDIDLKSVESVGDLISVCKFLTLTTDNAEERSELLGEKANRTLEHFRICEKGLTRFQPFLYIKIYGFFTKDTIRVGHNDLLKFTFK